MNCSEPNCRAPAMRGSEPPLCFWHSDDPAIIEAREAAGARGRARRGLSTRELKRLHEADETKHRSAALLDSIQLDPPEAPKPDPNQMTPRMREFWRWFRKESKPTAVPAEQPVPPVLSADEERAERQRVAAKRLQEAIEQEFYRRMLTPDLPPPERPRQRSLLSGLD